MTVKPVKIRGRLKGVIANIKCLMPHPMETGTRRDDAGEDTEVDGEGQDEGVVAGAAP